MQNILKFYKSHNITWQVQNVISLFDNNIYIIDFMFFLLYIYCNPISVLSYVEFFLKNFQNIYVGSNWCFVYKRIMFLIFFSHFSDGEDRRLFMIFRSQLVLL
jgi:hypothetical protein